MTTKKNGLLLSFDGVDSSGKETQTRRLVDRLEYHGHTVQVFETPDYNTPSGRDLKHRLQNKDGSWQNTPWEEKMRLFAANRAEHREEVLAALEQGHIVMYDRYVPSSLAFIAIEAFSPQTVDLYRKQVYEAVEREEYTRNKMPREDLSIFLDVPPDISHVLLEERKEQLHEDDEYTDRLDIQNRLYNEYDFMCTEDPKRFARIKCVLGNQLQSIDDVAELVWLAVIVNFPHLEKHG